MMIFEPQITSDVGTHSLSNMCKIMQFFFNDNTCILNYSPNPTCPVSTLILTCGSPAFTPYGRNNTLQAHIQAKVAVRGQNS